MRRVCHDNWPIKPVANGVWRSGHRCLWRCLYPSRSHDGHSGPADRTSIAMAERTCGEPHRFDPTGLLPHPPPRKFGPSIRRDLISDRDKPPKHRFWQKITPTRLRKLNRSQKLPLTGLKFTGQRSSDTRRCGTPKRRSLLTPPPRAFEACDLPQDRSNRSNTHKVVSCSMITWGRWRRAAQ
jgi:hypothetical protein